MLTGSCHCGTVRFTLAHRPEWLTACNCSVCRRLGALWAHADIADITLSRADDATFGYVRGDRTLAFQTCRTCGCTTHWGPPRPELSGRMAVNCRLCEQAELASLRIRRFDGDDTWRYLD